MPKTTFKRDKDGTLIAYRGGKKIGPVGGLGDGPASGAAKKTTARKKK